MKASTSKTDFQTPNDVPNHDGKIIVGYVLSCILLLATVYLANGGPGADATQLALAQVMP
jgi:hypothetical protein